MQEPRIMELKSESEDSAKLVYKIYWVDENNKAA